MWRLNLKDKFIFKTIGNTALNVLTTHVYSILVVGRCLITTGYLSDKQSPSEICNQSHTRAAWPKNQKTQRRKNSKTNTATNFSIKRQKNIWGTVHVNSCLFVCQMKSFQIIRIAPIVTVSTYHGHSPYLSYWPPSPPTCQQSTLAAIHYVSSPSFHLEATFGCSKAIEAGLKESWLCSPTKFLFIQT